MDDQSFISFTGTYLEPVARLDDLRQRGQLYPSRTRFVCRLNVIQDLDLLVGHRLLALKMLESYI